METRAHHVLIGLFTLLAAGAAVLFALWLGSSSTSREYKEYVVIFKDAVTGLSSGSAVQYSGIKVGDIKSLQLDPQDPRRVIARIRVGAEVPIKENTRARLSFTGITGNSVIELSHGTPSSPPLTSQEGPPVIVASPSPISALLADGEDLMTNVNKLMSNARSILSDENADSIGRTLNNVERATGSIAAQSENLTRLLNELTKATEQVNETLQRSSELVVTADTLLNQQGTRTLNQAEEALTSIASASQTLETLMNNNSEAFTTGMQGLSQLDPAINELRATLNSLRTITRRLEDNPTRFILGRDSMEEFEP
ncbi:MAG: MCE family protein [Pseudomonas sp.]|jgi:phospholipid/cholesterol/gamma-HCH transport system substrate-binding protein|nr:MCE family protein [Pseudomonas sp.]